MDRTSLLTLDLAMMEHREQVRNADRRQLIRQLSADQSVARFAGIRRTLGQSLIAAGEWIHVDECKRRAEELGEDSVSMTLAR